MAGRISLIFSLLFISNLALAQTAKPNIVIFLADDQGWGDLSISGNKNLNTPNIDSIAKAGASIDRFFVSPLCAPTRAEFFTGRYHPRTGVRGVSTGLERLNLDEKVIAQYFKEAGYATGAFGKWHNGTQWPYHPRARGFDEYYGFTSGHWGEYFDPPLDHNGKMVRGVGYIADDFTNHAIDFIERNKDKPFFCYIPFNTPHSPYAVPDEYWQRFKNKRLEMFGGRAGDAQNENLDVTRCSMAMTENLDANVGRVLKRLDDLKLAENTIVIYFSDNGPESFRWNGGMKGRKGTTDEGGVRVPFFIRWPAKIGAGTKVTKIAGAIDLLPTLAKLAGIELKPPKPIDGVDVSPLLLGTAKDWPDRMIFSHRAGRTSVRTRQYRLDDNGALFDMLADPGQAKDISKERPDVAKMYADAVGAWRKELAPGRDNRPFPVGYREFPSTILPARDGIPHGNIQRSSGAPNCSYFVNWTKPEDSMTWDIEVNTTGRYAVTIHYTAPEAGSLIELSFNGSKTTARVAPAWDPPPYNNQDTIPRPRGESQMKEFRPLDAGTIQLEKGRGLLTLRATEIPGKSVMDVRQIVLTLLEP
jgi:arylsulfatase A-like enzyme